ncbi:MAG: hypothetical protein Fur0012_11590 [Elusimicrobiota bacterium]
MSPFEINYSKINSWLFCPYLYFFVYIEKKYPPRNAPSSLGTSLHRALRDYGSGNLDLEGLLIAYEEGWENSGYETPQLMMEYYRKGKKMLEDFWISERDRKSRILSAEKDFEFALGELIVRGTIDRIDRLPDGRIELIEYKTGESEKYSEALASNLQLDIYALALKRAMNLEVSFISFVLLAFNKKITLPYDPSRLAKTEEFLVKTGEEIKTMNPTRKGDCSSCQINKLCRYSENK